MSALRFILLTVLLIVHSVRPMSINKRQFNSDGQQVSLCGAHNPCGWGVYDSNTRQMDYFVRNVCKCDKAREERCLKSSDDVSISAYVYRCIRSRAPSPNSAASVSNNLARSSIDSSSLEMNLKV